MFDEFSKILISRRNLAKYFGQQLRMLGHVVRYQIANPLRDGFEPQLPRKLIPNYPLGRSEANLVEIGLSFWWFFS